MSTNDEQNDIQQAKRHYSAVGAKELVLSTIAGLASGTMAVAASIRREFKQEVNNWPWMKGDNGLIAKHRKNYDAIDNKFADHPDRWKEHAVEKRSAKASFNTEFNNLLNKKYGIQTEGVTGSGVIARSKAAIYGTYQRLEHLGESNRRLDVWYKGGVVATVVGVGFYNLVTSIATRRKAREIEDLILDKAGQPMEAQIVKSEIDPTKPSHIIMQVASHEKSLPHTHDKVDAMARG